MRALLPNCPTPAQRSAAPERPACSAAAAAAAAVAARTSKRGPRGTCVPPGTSGVAGRRCPTPAMPPGLGRIAAGEVAGWGVDSRFGSCGEPAGVLEGPPHGEAVALLLAEAGADAGPPWGVEADAEGGWPDRAVVGVTGMSTLSPGVGPLTGDIPGAATGEAPGPSRKACSGQPPGCPSPPLANPPWPPGGPSPPSPQGGRRCSRKVSSSCAACRRGAQATTP
jgi:hypothetical protein